MPERKLSTLAMVLAAVCALAGVLSVVLRVDGVWDGADVAAAWSKWRSDGVLVGIPDESGQARIGDLRRRDVVVTIDGYRLEEGVGGLGHDPRPGDVLTYEVHRGQETVQVAMTLRHLSAYSLIRANWGMLLWLVLFAAVAAWLVVRRPDAAVGRPLMVGAGGLCGAMLSGTAGMTAIDVARGGALLWTYHVGLLGGAAVGWAGMLSLGLFALKGHMPVFGRPWPQTAAYLGPFTLVGSWSAVVLMAIGNDLDAIRIIHIGHFTVSFLSIAAAIVLMAISSWSLLRHQRQPWLVWLYGGALATIVSGVSLWLIPELFLGDHYIPARLLALTGLPFLVVAVFAVLRYRLLSIEAVISRSVTYAALAGTLMFVYLAAMWTLGPLLRLSSTAAAAGVTVIVAIAGLALHGLMRKQAIRIVYGQRGDPDSAMKRLGIKLSHPLTAEEILPAITATISSALRHPMVAVDVVDPGGQLMSWHQHGQPVGPVYELPIDHNGARVGRLRVSGPDPDELLAPADQSVLKRYAHQIAPSLRMVQLDLHVEQARRMERWRNEQRLHNMVSPQLRTIARFAERARRLAEREAETGKVVQRLQEIESLAREAGDELRHIINGSRPAALEHGLARAIRLHATSPHFSNIGMQVYTVGDLTDLPVETENAAYQIAYEAMANVEKHAAASHCVVLLHRRESSLELEIVDNGAGSESRSDGIGLRSMRSQARDAGGFCRVTPNTPKGTRVFAVFPLPEPIDDRSHEGNHLDAGRR